MIWILFVLVAIVFFVSGIIANHFFSERKEKKKLNEVQDETSLTNISYNEFQIQMFKEEWQTTIQTQMHFNDLIIRFRSIVLTVFIAGVGLIFSTKFENGINFADFTYLLLFAVVFWICCFLLDMFYYNKLLLGSVEHAMKFDNEPMFKKKGFFGLTTSISKKVNPYASNYLILIFYLIPIILLLVVLFIKFQSEINNLS